MQEMRAEEGVCEPEAMDSEDPLFLLYTSGSTGKPKALVHTQAGYLLYAALTHRVNLAPSSAFDPAGSQPLLSSHFLCLGRLFPGFSLQKFLNLTSSNHPLLFPATVSPPR